MSKLSTFFSQGQVGEIYAVITGGTATNASNTPPPGTIEAGSVYSKADYPELATVYNRTGTSNFKIITPPTTVNMSSIHNGNSIFVALAYSSSANNLFTSTDGETWTQSKPTAWSTRYPVVSMFFNNSHIVGFSSGEFFKSTDLITWTTISTPTTGTKSVHCTVIDSVGYIWGNASSASSVVYRSTDGITWSGVTIFGDLAAAGTDPNMFALIKGADGLYAFKHSVPSSGETSYSKSTDNGLTWGTSDRVNGLPTYGSLGSVLSIQWVNGFFVACGAYYSVDYPSYGPGIRYSTDLNTWTVLTSSNYIGLTKISNTSVVAHGENNQVLITTNTGVPAISAYTYGPIITNTSGMFQSTDTVWATNGNNITVTVGNTGKIYKSDGDYAISNGFNADTEFYVPTGYPGASITHADYTACSTGTTKYYVRY